MQLDEINGIPGILYPELMIEIVGISEMDLVRDQVIATFQSKEAEVIFKKLSHN